MHVYQAVRSKCQNTGSVIDHVVQSCFSGFKHADDVSVRVKSKVRFHIILLKPCREPASQIPMHGLYNLEVK